MSSHYKVIVSYAGSLHSEQIEAKKKTVADALGVCCEDVVLLPGLTVSVVEVPAAMVTAREKEDKDAEKAKAAAEKEAAKAEAEGAKFLAAEPAKAPEPTTHGTAHHGHKK